MISALREQEGEGDAPPPGLRERFFDQAKAIIGVEEAVGPGENPNMLGNGARLHAEQDQRARATSEGVISGIMRRAPSARTSCGPVSPQSRL